MTSMNGTVAATAEQEAAGVLRRRLTAQAGDMLPLCDFAGLLLAGYFSLVACAMFPQLAPDQVLAAGDPQRLIWIIAAIAPFLLYDPHFSAGARAGHATTLARSFTRRLMLLFAVACAITFAGRWLEEAAHAMLALWLGTSLLWTVGVRVLLARYLRHSAPQACNPSITGTATQAQAIGYVGDRLLVTLLADRPIKRWNAVLKSGADLVLGTLVTVLALPVLASIALAIKLDSPGPILFRQRRHGFNNREFDIYKFRTMRCVPTATDAVLVQTVRGDDRVTRVGRFLRKWSLDELPQVFNVLEGNMSLVGPRPHAVNMRTEARLGHEIIAVYPHRHRVRPGITGWSQINGSRGATNTAAQLCRRVELDLHYVENWSLLLDLKILTLTTREVLRATNAY